MSIFTKNIRAIRRKYGESLVQHISNAVPEPDLHIVTSKRSERYTARYKDKYLSSPYDPDKESKRSAALIVQKQREGAHDGIVFLGFGLGYHIAEVLARSPRLSLLIIEPSVERIASVFHRIDYTGVIQNESITFYCGSTPHEVLEITKNCGMRIPLLWGPAQLTMHQPSFFQEVSEILYRYTAQGRLNRNTLIKFSKRWVTNSIKNLISYPAAYSIDILHGAFSGIPALLCAAGPSFDSIAPYLSEWKKKALVIAVDTIVSRMEALQCPPDIIVSMDPQYWNSRHLDPCNLQNSILIVDSSSSPRILRKIQDAHGFPFFAKSHFPLASYLDPQHQTKLGAGGSVSTSAWDLCTFLGCSKLFFIGLDLGYPLNRSHARHSLYETIWNWSSSRLQSTETKLTSMLFNASPYFAKDYGDKNILSDARLELYSFWFTKAAESISAYCLAQNSRKIQGVSLASPELVYTLEEIHPKKEAVIASLLNQKSADTQKVKEARLQRLSVLHTALCDLQQIVKKQLHIIEGCNATHKLSVAVIQNLEDLDKKLAQNFATPFVNFLLQSAARSVFSYLGEADALTNSKGLYQAYAGAIEFYIELLNEQIKG